MATQRFSEAPTQTDIGFLLIQWKDRPDADKPWWVHWYYDHIYVPFQRFSFKHFGIPRSKQRTVETLPDGTVRETWSWFENGSFFDDPDRADAACVDEFDGYKPIYKNRMVPRNSAEIGAVVFPRSKKPKRWFKPTYSVVLKDRKEDERDKETLNKYITRLHQALDR